MADLYTNRIGNVIVVAPSRDGRLDHLAESVHAVLNRDTGDLERCLTRWIFADVPTGTLRDQWDNPYDHLAHSLLAGSTADGEAFLKGLAAAGFAVEQADNLFCPLKSLDASDVTSSDELRSRHPRAFALARRDPASVEGLLTAEKDAEMLGG